jgi:pimeloyl-ACP methyl ester carboxylesterase
VVAPDLRGHGLSDAPVDGYAVDGLAGDALAAAEGAGLLDDAGARLVLVGHGFGAMVAASLARSLGERCAGLVLVDGGWEELGGPAGPEPEELLRALEEPPEVLRSMAAYLADRAGFDPATWDADQEHAARAAVVELPAGRVVLVTRPHVLAGCVEAMLGYRPAEVLPAVIAPLTVLVAADDESGGRRRALAAAQDAVRASGRPPMTVVDLPAEGHNLMRYRPELVAWAIDAASLAAPAYHPGS